MNSTITNQPQPPPPSSSTCHHNHNNNLTAFCSPCLSQRLNILHHSSLLCRTKSSSYSSASKFDTLNLEPQRKSCARNTLLSLFLIDHQQPQQQVVSNNEIRVSEENTSSNLNELENDILDMEAKIDAILENLKSVNHDIHLRLGLDSHPQKPSFWSTASSVFTKKWINWRPKHTTNNNHLKTTLDDYTALPVISQQYRETQSEIADYGYGRRSADIHPRFSLDVPHPPRYSFHQPSHSRDAYFIARPPASQHPTLRYANSGGTTRARWINPDT